MLPHLLQIIIEGATYDTIKVLVVSFVATGALAFIFRLLKKIESIKDIIYFSAACFFAVFLTLNLITPKTQGPQLAGGIQQVISGDFGNGRDTIAVLSMNVLNAGSMQSIIKNWSVEVVIDDQKYNGSFIVPPPKNFTFNNQKNAPGTPASITYHGDDNLIDKAMSPIQSGGMVNGVLFVLFRDVEATAFKAGAQVNVRYEDALSKSYIATIRMTARSSDIMPLPGVHADLVCPVPTGGFSKNLPAH